MALSAVLSRHRDLGSLFQGRSRKRLAGEVAAGAVALAAGGFAIYFLKERKQEEAAHRVVESDGAFSLRRYEPSLVAEVRRSGTLAGAMDQGFEPLSDYISGKAGARLPGESRNRIAMAVPVSVVPADRAGSWDIRLTLPRACRRETLPKPASGVTIRELPARTIAALRFSGRGTDRELIARKRSELLKRLADRGLVAVGEPEFAAYNAPIVPGVMRRNEWWVDLSGS